MDEKILSKRILFTQDNCPFCRLYLNVLPEINIMLESNKRIKTVNVKEHNPLIDTFSETLKREGTPLLYLNGYIMAGASTEEYIRAFLTGFLNAAGDL